MNPERLRKINKILFFLWIFPGIPVSIYFRASLVYLVFISVYAIIMTHFIEWRQEHRASPEMDEEDQPVKGD